MVAVKKRSSVLESYQLTGKTGSMRYMAPEVFLQQQYTELVDVYSFGVILWQLTSGRVPFEGFNRRQLEDKVVRGGWRPPIDGSLPAALRDLISACWSPHFTQRPSFARILSELEAISAQLAEDPGRRKKAGSSSSVPMFARSLSRRLGATLPSLSPSPASSAATITTSSAGGAVCEGGDEDRSRSDLTLCNSSSDWTDPNPNPNPNPIPHLVLPLTLSAAPSSDNSKGPDPPLSPIATKRRMFSSYF